MKIGQALKMALKSLATKKGRSFLTMLGIIIGLAAVIALVTYAQGQNLAIKALYDSQGTNILNVSVNDWSGSGRDVGQMLYDYCLGLDSVVGVTPNGYVYEDLTITYGAKTLARQDRYGYAISIGGGGMMVDGGDQEDHYPNIKLGNDKFGSCNDYKIAKGREISYLEIQDMAQVCVLGSDTADYLFSFADPIDKTITINGLPFRVVGVYQSKSAGIKLGNAEEAQWVADSLKRQDRLLVIPSTMTRYFNRNEPISEYVVKVKSKGDLKEVVTELNGFLPSIINEQNGYFYVDNPSGYAEDLDEADALQQRFLGIIAAISLVVAGIGIMNIMLVTVTERTREIGIRRAIGAERSSIVIQFLIEAAMLCGMGGIIGILIGTGGSLLVGRLMFQMTIYPAAWITLCAFTLSVALGILFGIYPAAKAARLQPVEALRAE